MLVQKSIGRIFLTVCRKRSTYNGFEYSSKRRLSPAKLQREAADGGGSNPPWRLHTNEVAVTFLSYPGFDEDPHPALADDSQALHEKAFSRDGQLRPLDLGSLRYE